MVNVMMLSLHNAAIKPAQRGSTLLEVLITIVILAIGLLGLAGLQSRLQVSEMESYQRAQALVLLNDMASRITSNRNAAESYASAKAYGYGEAACTTEITTQKDRDISEWCNALKGAAETSGATQVGAMVGGRGCIEKLGPNRYMVTVTWQGLVPISAPPASVSCGKEKYDDATSGCVGDLCRRAVTTLIEIAKLS